MSNISDALKKVQKLRQNEQVASMPIVDAPAAKASIPDAPASKISFVDIPVVDVPQDAPRNNLMIILAIGTLVSVLISIAVFVIMMSAESRQNKVLGLQDTINAQDKKINDLINRVSRTKTISDSQIGEMKLRLRNENNALKDQISNLASDSKDNYDSLKEAIIDDKQEIDFLDNSTKKLNQKIEAISASNSQPQGVTSPASGT